MKSDILKNRQPFPFETIAVAFAFSPRIEAILSEAKRLRDLFGAKLLLIHSGKETNEKQIALNDLIQKLGLQNAELIWVHGHPVDSILQVCKDNVVDLLIAGAAEKESIFRFYVGSISREICRKAKCSVLMFTEPSVSGTEFKSIMVNGQEHPKTKYTLGTAVYFCRAEKAQSIEVIREIHIPVIAMSQADSSAENDETYRSLILEEENKLKVIIDAVDTQPLKVDAKTLIGKTGYTIAEYARTKKSELLVINSPDHHHTLLDRIFTHDIEYILADIPCNLLIVHSRVEDELKKLSE